MQTLVFEKNGIAQTIEIAPIPEGLSLQNSDSHADQFIIDEGEPVPDGAFVVTDWAQGLWHNTNNVTRAMVNAERDRRIGLPFNWHDKIIKADKKSADAIEKMAALAAEKSIANIIAGDATDWMGGGVTSTWSDNDGVKFPVSMDEMTSIRDTLFSREQVLRKKADEILKLDPVPDDYTDDKYWG